LETIAISALQHILYCERQFALIHLEKEWLENRFTAEGRVLHDRAHESAVESRGRVRAARSISVCSEKLGLSGQCDVVEFHADGRVIPIEYKRGKPKSHRADEVQLCAQAMCLEEMRSVQISISYLFYGTTRRRVEVALDEELRQITLNAALRARSILESGKLPPALYEKAKCSACSLLPICQPESKKAAAAWFSKQLENSVAP
jgi:CRISPR-associated exonuclease Cas4